MTGRITILLGMATVACTATEHASEERSVKEWHFRPLVYQGSDHGDKFVAFHGGAYWGNDSVIVSELISQRLMWLSLNDGDLTPAVSEPWRPNPVYAMWRRDSEHLIAASMRDHLDLVDLQTGSRESVAKGSVLSRGLLGAIGPGCNDEYVMVPWTLRPIWHDRRFYPHTNQSMVRLTIDGSEIGALGIAQPSYLHRQLSLTMEQWQPVGCYEGDVWLVNLFNGQVGRIASNSITEPTWIWAVSEGVAPVLPRVSGTAVISRNVIHSAALIPGVGIAVAVRIKDSPITKDRLESDPGDWTVALHLYTFDGELKKSQELERGFDPRVLVPVPSGLLVAGVGDPKDSTLAVARLYELP